MARQSRHAALNIGGLGEILRFYINGFYPYWDEDIDKFYWDRGNERTYVHLNAGTTKIAKRLLNEARDYTELTEEKHVDAVLEALANDRIKPNTWVRGPVIEIYKTLHAHNLLVTVEVHRNNKLAGALLGVRLPGVLIAETMFSFEPKLSASKAALAFSILRYAERNYKLLDVQVKHHRGHPVSRLREVTTSTDTYLQLVRNITRAHDGGRLEWIAESYRLHDLNSKADELKEFLPDICHSWHRAIKVLSRTDDAIPEAPKYEPTDAVNADPRQHLTFPANIRDWATAVPELVQRQEGVSLNILGFQVMQSWETPLMIAMAQGACKPNDITLEIGYGLGICATEIQRISPRLHVIIECNREIALLARRKHERRIAEGRVIVLEGFWTDICQTGPLAAGKLTETFGVDGFDSIVFDTFPLTPDQLSKNQFSFFSEASRLLRDGGRFTYYSNEKRTIGRAHQRAIREAFGGAMICQSPVAVNPWLDCEYWRAQEILNIVVIKGRSKLT